MRLITNLLLLAIIFWWTSCHISSKEQDKTNTKDVVNTKPAFALVIHGGAGVIRKEDMTADKEVAYLNKLNEALSIGDSILRNKGTSLAAVEAVIKVLENSPLFNAGKGAVFTNEGKNELDASVMDGSNHKAGAVGGLTKVKNPITAAIAVMNKSEHVMMIGEGAEKFCAMQGIELVEPSYFYTQERWDALQKLKNEQSLTNIENKKGTVGCVALDTYGNIVAGTSTGGMTNKRFGRIGDTPIIGAGTYASNKTCGVSCTGHGEYFIRYTVARDVAAMMEYKNISCEEAAKTIIHDKLKKAGGEGGLIAIDNLGNVIMEFNSEGMFRGYALPHKKDVKIYKD